MNSAACSAFRPVEVVAHTIKVTRDAKSTWTMTWPLADGKMSVGIAARKKEISCA